MTTVRLPFASRRSARTSRSQCAMERMFGAIASGAPVTRSVEVGTGEAVATSAASPALTLYGRHHALLDVATFLKKY